MVKENSIQDKIKILIVGGTFDENGGKPSGLIKKIIDRFYMVKSCRNDFDFLSFNGGKYENLVEIQKFIEICDIVLWWPNVPNNLPKLREIKQINQKIISVISKRNDNNKYTFQEILQRTLEQKGNLNVIFEKQDEEHFKMSLIDPLGNLFYSGTHFYELVEELLKRAIFLTKISRVSTKQDLKNNLDWYYKMFHQNNLSNEENKFYEIEEKKQFVNLVKEYGEIFTKTIFNVKEQSEIKRFLGNASFRCPKGFPSFREGEYIFVSRRNIDKTHISIDDFIPTYLKDNQVYFLGENKPSVDSPVQLRLYQKLPNIKFMLHAHVYIKDAPFTNSVLPCGALEEVSEILKLIEKNCLDGLNTNFSAINLKGHGCLILSDNVEKIKDLKDRIIARPKPESQIPERIY